MVFSSKDQEELLFRPLFSECSLQYYFLVSVLYFDRVSVVVCGHQLRFMTNNTGTSTSTQ